MKRMACFSLLRVLFFLLSRGLSSSRFSDVLRRNGHYFLKREIIFDLRIGTMGDFRRRSPRFDGF